MSLLHDQGREVAQREDGCVAPAPVLGKLMAGRALAIAEAMEREMGILFRADQ